MGRTNSTYRDEITRFEQEWQPFRRMLRRRHQPHFDTLVEHARNHAQAGGDQNPVDPKWGILVSICLAQQREIAALRDELDDRRVELDESWRYPHRVAPWVRLQCPGT